MDRTKVQFGTTVSNWNITKVMGYRIGSGRQANGMTDSGAGDRQNSQSLTQRQHSKEFEDGTATRDDGVDKKLPQMALALLTVPTVWVGCTRNDRPL